TIAGCRAQRFLYDRITPTPLHPGPHMLTRRLTRYITALGLVLAAVVATNANAQGVTTGGLNGFVTDNAGNPLDNVQIEITNRTTGFTARALSRAGGKYSIIGL